MRTALHVHIDTASGNQTIRDGGLPKTIQALTEQLKPEASYFFADRGRRSAFFVFDMADPSQIPAIVEPLFTGFNAEVEITPVMNLDDLQRGLTELAKTL